MKRTVARGCEVRGAKHDRPGVEVQRIIPRLQKSVRELEAALADDDTYTDDEADQIRADQIERGVHVRPVAPPLPRLRHSDSGDAVRRRRTVDERPTWDEIAEAANRLSTLMERRNWNRREEWYAVNRVLRDALDRDARDRLLVARMNDKAALAAGETNRG